MPDTTTESEKFWNDLAADSSPAGLPLIYSTLAEVLAPYSKCEGIEASISHGGILIKAGGRELDVSKDAGGWWVVRSWDLSDEEPVRVRTRGALDAHVEWVSGEVS